MGIYSQYATKENLAEFLDIVVEDLPSDSNRLLKRASEMVQQAILENYNSANTKHVEAAKLAVCSQVEYWQNMGEASSIIGTVQNFSLGSLTMNFDENKKGGNVLCDRARNFLNQQGLLYRGVRLSYKEGETV